MGPSLDLDVLHRGVLEAALFTQKRDLVPEPLEFRPEAAVEALSGPAEGGGQSEIGEGDGVHSR